MLNASGAPNTSALNSYVRRSVASSGEFPVNCGPFVNIPEMTEGELVSCLLVGVLSECSCTVSDWHDFACCTKDKRP